MTPEFPTGRAPQFGTLTVKGPQEFTNAGSVREHVLAVGGTGWICTTDKVVRVPSKSIGQGPLLSAEVALDSARSMHVRYDGSTWRVWEMVETLGDGPHVAFDESFLSTEGSARMEYRTWWHLVPEGDDVSVWRPFASRFVGWKE